MKTPIKYDKQFQKICKSLMIVSGCVLALFILTLPLLDEPAVELTDWMVYMIMAAYMAAPLFVLSAVLYADATIYLRRLQKNHFVVPKKKKEYQDDLGRVPRSEASENCYAKDSRIAMLLFLAAYVVFLILDAQYLMKWMVRYEVRDAMALFLLLMVLHSYFPVRAFLFYRQRDTKLYVDEVDVRDGRKVRTSLMGAIGLLLVVGCIGVFSVITAHSMTKYVYRSRQKAYEETMDDFEK